MPSVVVDGRRILKVLPRRQQGAGMLELVRKSKHSKAKPSVSKCACQGRCDESADPRYDEPLPSARILKR